MIKRVTIRKFKRFDEVTFDFPGNVVLAGPNNTGKTTVLQAIAAWSLALRQWKTLNQFHRRGGAHPKKPITRQTFFAVPLSSFDLLWQERLYSGSIEIEVQSTSGWTITMEFISDTTEQILVRPIDNVQPEIARDANIDVVFVPPMTGLAIEEPVYQRPYLDQRLGLARPGEVLRNLLIEAHNSEQAWFELQKSISTLFGYQLCVPDATGATIISEYMTREGGPRYDIASAGSGFQQILMLLTFLNTRPASVLLLDEPDAHLHIILQDAIWNQLKTIAERQGSQLIIATHSEVIINSVEPRDLCVLLDVPKKVSDEQERRIVADSLRLLSNTDIMLALDSPGILYLEGETDLRILREWSRILDHPLNSFFNSRSLFWKPIRADRRLKGSGINSTDHYQTLLLANPNLSALELVDGDAHPGIQSTEISGDGYQRLRWNRYEIESYLLHSLTLARFIQRVTNTGIEDPPTVDLMKHFSEKYPPDFLKNPFEDLTYLKNTKARTELIPPALSAAGLHGFPYQRYSEIAAMMLPEEIHPEVKEKLNLIQKAFRL